MMNKMEFTEIFTLADCYELSQIGFTFTIGNGKIEEVEKDD